MAYLTEEERKQKISHQCDRFNFVSVVDLSGGVKVYHPFGASDKVFTRAYSEMLARDTASFIAWWMITFHEKLNGFQGFGSVKFEICNPAE